MDKLKQYSIPFVGLEKGVHHFSYVIDDAFWEHYAYAAIAKSDIMVELDFDKKNDFFALSFGMDGTVNVECDRCSERFDLEISSANKVYVKYDDGRQSKEEEADIIFISRAETEFNIAQLIYEFINLCMPLHKTHPYDGEGKSRCNKKMIKELKKHSTKHKEVDPRWDALKKISNN